MKPLNIGSLGKCSAPSGSLPSIEAVSVSKAFSVGVRTPVLAVNEVSLAVPANEFFTLLGPSGCGKTTLLRLIAGFEEPTGGDILLFGESLKGLPPYHRQINTVFQHYALFPSMTVAQNVGFGLEMLGVGAQQIRERVSSVLSLVKMEGLSDRHPSHLSGGQQQRVALARALAPSPKVLLLDEPLSALDLKLRQAMRLELKTLQAKTGITFIFVTHDQEEALTMSDRIAVMSHGSVQQIGTPDEIYNCPANRFVAEFMGDNNIIESRIIAINGDSMRIELNGIGEITTDRVNSGKVGDTVITAIRPERLTFSPSATSEVTNVLPGKILAKIFLGTDTAYHVELVNKQRILVRDMARDHSFNPCVDDRVAIRVPASAAVVLHN